MRRVTRWLRWMVGLLVVGALVAAALWPRTVEVEVVRAARGPLVVTIDEDGETRVRDRFLVTAPVSGEVLRVQLRPGDAVSVGTTLAIVRPAAPVPLDARSRAEAEALVQSAASAVGRLEAERNRAMTVLSRATTLRDRARALFGGGAVSREEVEARETESDAAEDAVHAADFAVAQAKHDLDVARARVQPQPAGQPMRDFIITSPVGGVVLKRYQESQAVVPAGALLLEIGDPAGMEIRADLLSADAVRIKPGSQVLVEQWGGPQTLRGRVRRIEPSGFTKVSALGVEEQRVNVLIDFDRPKDVALGDNFRVEVRIVTWQSEDVLTVLPGALFRQGDAWATYVVEDGRAHLRAVTVGQRSDHAVQVIEGLTEGTSVIVYPPDSLKDGDRVRATIASR